MQQRIEQANCVLTRAMQYMQLNGLIWVGKLMHTMSFVLIDNYRKILIWIFCVVWLMFVVIIVFSVSIFLKFEYAVRHLRNSITKCWYFCDGHLMFHVSVVHSNGLDWLSLFEQQMQSIKQIFNDWRQSIWFNWNKWRLSILENFKCLFLGLCVCVFCCESYQFVSNNEMYL